MTATVLRRLIVTGMAALMMMTLVVAPAGASVGGPITARGCYYSAQNPDLGLVAGHVLSRGKVAVRCATSASTTSLTVELKLMEKDTLSSQTLEDKTFTIPKGQVTSAYKTWFWTNPTWFACNTEIGNEELYTVARIQVHYGVVNTGWSAWSSTSPGSFACT